VRRLEAENAYLQKESDEAKENVKTLDEKVKDLEKKLE